MLRTPLEPWIAEKIGSPAKGLPANGSSATIGQAAGDAHPGRGRTCFLQETSGCRGLSQPHSLGDLGRLPFTTAKTCGRHPWHSSVSPRANRAGGPRSVVRTTEKSHASSLPGGSGADGGFLSGWRCRPWQDRERGLLILLRESVPGVWEIFSAAGLSRLGAGGTVRTGKGIMLILSR